MKDDTIKDQILSVFEIANWPEMTEFIERAASRPRPDWDLPLLACQAVGSDPSASIPGAAAVACMYVSIILVDDILDEDPRGEYLRSGVGPTANMALAFQAAAFRIISQSLEDAEMIVAVNASLARLALATALGQSWDAQNLVGEENYWKVVQAKSTPFYGAALHIGALLGGADLTVSAGLQDLGNLMGEVIQIHDDLFDAFETPANPDWKQGRNNLSILYASTADHPDRDQFLDLLPHVDSPSVLQEAQHILISSGAVSYCAYHLAKRHQQARKLLGGLPLADPNPVMDLLERQSQPLIRLLETCGVEVPAELISER